MSRKPNHEEILRYIKLKNDRFYIPQNQQKDLVSSEISKKNYNSTSKDKADNQQKKKMTFFIKKIVQSTGKILRKDKGDSNYGAWETYTDLSLSGAHSASTLSHKHIDVDGEDRISLLGNEFDATSFLSDPHSTSNDSGIDLSTLSKSQTISTNHDMNLNIPPDDYNSIEYIDTDDEEQHKISNNSGSILDLNSRNGDRETNASAMTADRHHTLLTPEHSIDSYSTSHLVDSKTQENSLSDVLKIHSNTSDMNSISNDSGIDLWASPKSQAMSIDPIANKLNAEKYSNANYPLYAPSTDSIQVKTPPIQTDYSSIYNIKPIRSSSPINGRSNNNLHTSSNSAFTPVAQNGINIAPPNQMTIRADIHSQSSLNSSHIGLSQLNHSSNTSFDIIGTDNIDHLLELNGSQSDYSLDDLLEANNFEDKHGSHSSSIHKNHSFKARNPFDDSADDYPAELNPFDDLTDNYPAKLNPLNTDGLTRLSQEGGKNLIWDRTVMSILNTPSPTPPPYTEREEKKVKKSILHKGKSFLLHSITKVVTPKTTISYKDKPVSSATYNSPEENITEKKKSKKFREAASKFAQKFTFFQEMSEGRKNKKQEKKEKKAQLEAEQQDNIPNKSFGYCVGSFTASPQSSFRKSYRKTKAQLEKGCEQIKEKAPGTARSACKAVGKGIKYVGVGVGGAVGGLFSGIKTGVTKVTGNNFSGIGGVISKARNTLLIGSTFAIAGACAVLAVEKSRGALLDPKITYIVMGVCFAIGMLVSGHIINGCKKIADKCRPQQSQGSAENGQNIPSSFVNNASTTNNIQNGTYYT